jgi:lysocardiolipin and lysophospholipid acyltransferase
LINKFCWILGWAMQNAMYIFLKRRWEHDEGYLREVLGYFKEISYPLQLLLFPEGTNLDSVTKVKSDGFARKNNLPCYEYVLHPRVRGFTFCMENLRNGRLDAVHDITVGYDVNHSFWEIDLILGNFPREMHFYIERHPTETLPEDEKELEKWCTKKWEEKEERLKNFYTIGQGFSPLEETKPKSQEKVESKARNQLKIVLCFWFLFIATCILAICYSIIVRWYFYVMFTIYILLSILGNGTDRLQLWSHQKFNKKKE